jgi:hypothetical protein
MSCSTVESLVVHVIVEPENRFFKAARRVGHCTRDNCAVESRGAKRRPLQKSIYAKHGANPTIASYNTGVVKVYNAANSIARF